VLVPLKWRISVTARRTKSSQFGVRQINRSWPAGVADPFVIQLTSSQAISMLRQAAHIECQHDAVMLDGDRARGLWVRQAARQRLPVGGALVTGSSMARDAYSMSTRTALSASPLAIA